MREFSNEKYDYVVSTRHQGLVITFGARMVIDQVTGQSNQQIDYRVLDIKNYDPAVPIDEERWGAMKTLEFPKEYRPLGMSLLTVPADSSLKVKNTSFQVFSDTKYLFVFRQSLQNTLYVTRFILDIVNLELHLVWENRYRRSKQKDIATNDKDTLGYKDMDQEIFIEPTLELAMVRNLSDVGFSVALSPSQLPGQEVWQIFAYNSSTQKIDLFQIPRSADGLFDLSTKVINPASSLIRPDQSFKIRVKDTGVRAILPQKLSPALIYTRQEEVTLDPGTSDDKTHNLRRSVRLMLAFTSNDNDQVGILDFGIGKDGSLTKVPDVITIRDIAKSAMPVAMPTIMTDDKELTLSAGLLTFVQTKDAVTLLEGADGLIHLYFNSESQQGAKNFQVAQLSTKIARAQFTVDTSTNVKVNFVSRQTGRMMNEAVVKVENGSLDSLANVYLAYTPPTGANITEHWNNLPRQLNSFLKIFSSQATSDIFDPQIKTGERLFFDYRSIWRLYNVAVQHGDLTLAYQLPDCLIEQANSVITITDGDHPELCNLTIILHTGDQMMGEIWKNLPRDAEKICKIINGKSKQYDYSQASFTYPVYKVSVGSGNVWFASKKEKIANALIQIEVLSLAECKLTLQIKDETKTITETWNSMPVEPQEFAKILQGSGSKYNYKNATSTDTTVDLSTGSALFYIINANATTQITSRFVNYAPSLMGGSTLIIAIPDHVSGPILNRVQQIRQGVTATNQEVYQYQTSGIFTLNLSKLVTDLDCISIRNTPWIGAPRTKDGLDCAWIPAKRKSALECFSSCIACPTGKLDMLGNLTMEAWIKPQAWSDPQPYKESFSRIFSYTSEQTRFTMGLKPLKPLEGGDYYTFFAGARGNLVYADALALDYDKWAHLAASYQSGHALRFDGNDYIYCENSDTLNIADSLTLEAWVKMPNGSLREKIIVSKYGTEPDEQSYQLIISGNYVTFSVRTDRSNSSESEELVIQGTFIPGDDWFHVTANVKREIKADSDGYQKMPTVTTQFVYNLYINGKNVRNNVTTYPGALQINCSNTPLTIGGIPTDAKTLADALSQPFELCQVRLWNRILDDTEILNNYLTQKLAISDASLISNWTLDQGEGIHAYDQKKNNDGLISRPGLWKFTSLGSQWTLYANGEIVGHVKDNVSNFGGYGADNGFLIGGMKNDNVYRYQYVGIMDELRIWSTARTEEEIRDNMYCLLTGNEIGLKAYWDFDMDQGKVLKDKTGMGSDGHFIENAIKNTLVLLNDKGETINLELIIAGGGIEAEKPYFVSKENAIYFTIKTEGSIITARMNPKSQRGLFIVERGYTNTILTDGGIMSLLKTSGTEVYFRYIHDCGKFTELVSSTGWIQGATIQWVPTPAPVGSEIPQVVNCLDGYANDEYDLNIQGQPAVVEYGDLQADSEGNLKGVMKRSYAYIKNHKIQLLTGFQVGDLDLVYIGQVQTSPKLVGYIEGPPPVPSENLTVQDPKTDNYVGNTSVELTEEDATLHTYSTSRETGFDMSVEAKAGFFLGNKVSAGLFLLKEIQGVEQKVGVHSVFEHSLGWLNESSIGAGTITTINKKLDMCGFLEEKKDYDQNGEPRFLNPEVGQRYVPNNMGYALVKSNTADMYALKLRTNGSLVAYQMTPNPNIPQDWNIIMFPLNPAYVKNGTLDGMVGLVADPDYPSAIVGEKGSYFKPKEAYELKNKIDQEQKEIETYFIQYNAGVKGRSDDSSLPGGDLLRDWVNKISKRSMVNTYVWTAQGGLYSQEEQFTDIKTESTGGSFHILGKGGVYADLKFSIFGFGCFFELDALFGGHVNTSAVSGTEYTDTFGLKVDVTAEGWLNKWDPETKQYLSYDCPGKVDAYRFMAFYLAPDTNNFEEFFEKVVDDNWLQNSIAPNALALREVQVDKNPVWRVLYRTTFVSRIPPAFESAPLDSGPAPIKKPVNISANSWLIDLVTTELRTQTPSAAEIGKAVDCVFDEILPTVSEWWYHFLKKAEDPDSSEHAILTTLSFYVKTYLNKYYMTLDSI